MYLTGRILVSLSLFLVKGDNGGEKTKKRIVNTFSGLIVDLSMV